MLPSKIVMMRERRKEVRIQEEDKVVLGVPADGAEEDPERILLALTRDISPGGARLVSGIAVHEGDRVRLEIGLTSSRRLFRGTGTVRWVSRLFKDDIYEIGVEFAEVDAERVGALLEHIYGRPAD